MKNPPEKVLFVCTANYYRSRLAEEIFNHLAAEAGLAIRAESAGFLADHYRAGSINPGTISAHALDALKRLGLNPVAAGRAPRQFGAHDHGAGIRIIALSQTEHRPMATRLFPDSVERIEYWEIEDIGFEAPESATKRLAEKVRELVDELKELG